MVEGGGQLGESQGGIGLDQAPDVTIAWRGDAGIGSYELSGLGRYLSVENGKAGAANISDEDFGWGFNLAGRWTAGALEPYAWFNYGDGIGRYIIHGFDNDAFLTAAGQLETVESWGAGAGFDYHIDDSQWVNLIYGRFENDDPARSNGIDTIQSIHANYFWDPAAGLTLGVGMIWGECECYGGKGDNTRIQFMAQRSF